MKKTKLLSVLVSGALLSLTMSSASAIPSLVQSSNGILTLKFNTPGGKIVTADNFIANYGHLVNGTCNITQTFNLKIDKPAYKLQIFQTTYSISSVLIASLIGSNYGCVNSAVVYKGKFYSTGYIHLTWDKTKNEYTQAQPNNIVIDLTK